MAFQSPVGLSIQGIASVSSELWPSMSSALQAPWRSFCRPASTSAKPTNSNGTAEHAIDTISSVETQARPSFPLPEPLASVPLSRLGFRSSADAIVAPPTVSGIMYSVSANSLRLSNPMARSMPLKAMMARQYSTISRLGPFTNLRPIPRTGNVGLHMIQQRSIHASSHSLLRPMELTANNNPQSATAQAAFYNQLIRAGLPEIVVERYQTGRFATNASCDSAYLQALQQVGKSEKAAAIQATTPQGNNSLTSEQMQAISQAVAAHTKGGKIAGNSSASGERASPLYVVVEESFRNTLFKWFKFIAWFALVVYASYAILTMIIEASGMLRKVGGAPQAEVRPELQNTRFSDVHGCEEAKEELQDLVEFLKNPQRFNTLGGRLPKGVLLVGPPGTGKTLLARAVAGEAGVPFYYMSGSEFDEVYVGVGAKRVRELFNAAKTKAPAIVFIDELDAVGGKRNDRDAAYHKQTLNQLLTELDGFDQNSGIIFIAATNHPQLLDKALVRPGRFDRNVEVPLPDVRGRAAILKHHLKKITFDGDIDSFVIARGTPGFSGADLENLVNSAAIHASKNKSKIVSEQDLDWAKDKIIMGAEKRSMIIQEKDKLATAYHEGGHALVSLYTRGGEDLYKATILPRGGSLGATHYLPQMDQTNHTKIQLLGRIDTAMGGKVAEEIVYGSDNVSTGAGSDIQQATSVAFAMVIDCGMSDVLGNVAFRNDYERLSSETKQIIESEVRRLVQESYARAKTILTEKREELDRLAKALVDYETLDKSEILKVIKGEKIDKTRVAPGTPIKVPVMPMPPGTEGTGAGGGSDPDPPPGVPGQGEPSIKSR